MIKAVITAAGRGTRLLPLTKSLPKEELYLSLISSDVEIEKTTIIVE